MPEFKNGDPVLTASDGEGSVIGIEQSGRGTSILVELSGGKEWWYAPHELKHVTEPPLQDWEAELLLTPFEKSVRYHTNKIADLLIAKNKAYGDSALNPVRIFSKASRIEQLNVRIDDKISRIQRGTDFGDEDTVRDLIGYLVLRLIAEESE